MDGAATDTGRGTASVVQLREKGTHRARCILAEGRHLRCNILCWYNGPPQTLVPQHLWGKAFCRLAMQ